MSKDYSTVLKQIEEAETKLLRKYANLLEVNSDLDRTLVSFQANKKASEHRWCKYKEGFSSSLIRYIVEKLGIKSGTVLDPFAGSGTTLFTTSEMGLDSIGIELLPSSNEIIEARQVLRDTDKEAMAISLRKFKSSRIWEKAGETLSLNYLRITKGAYPEETEKQLGRYLFEIKKIGDSQIEKVLRFAALCVLESISYTRKDGQYLRWDWRSGRTTGKKRFDKGVIYSFTDAISKKIEDIAEDLSGESYLFDFNPKKSGKINLLKGSCLNLLPTLKTNSISAVITSPPYCNRYDYTRTYALELALLGLGEEEVKDLRQTMLSCTVENREKSGLNQVIPFHSYSDASEAWKQHESLNKIVDYLFQCREDRTINNTGIPRMVHNYFKEMALIIFECARVMKEDACFVMVNDNVRYQGAHVPVDLILSDFAQKAGLEVEKIWVLPKGKGNSSQQMGLHGRVEVRKCVYVWRKPKAKQASRSNREVALAH
jgi:DNA modification methylase